MERTLRSLLLLALFGWLVLPAVAQSYYRTYGQPGRSEVGTTLLQASDGSIYLGGAVNDSALVQRMDVHGNILWSRKFRPSGQATKLVIDLQEAPDGSIIGCGLGLTTLVGVMREGFHFRMDPDGSFMWVRRWTDPNVYIKNIRAISANEYLLFGCDYDMSTSTYADILTARVDAATGNINWVSPRMDLYNTVPYIDDICGVTELNGAYYMTGRVFTNGAPLSTCRINVTKFNADGQHQWTRYLMYSNTQNRRMYGADIIGSNDSLTVFWMGDITGSTSNWRLGVTRLDQNGNIAWSKAFDVGGSSLELAEKIVSTDFGYAMTAQYTFGQDKRMLLMGIDHSGNLLWTRTHGPQAQPQYNVWQYQKNLIALEDGLLYTGGVPAKAGSDLLLVRTGWDGIVECEATGSLSVTTTVLPNTTFNSPYGSNSENFSLQSTLPDPTATFLQSGCDGLTVDLGPDQTTCSGVLLDATTEDATYLWQDGSMEATFQTVGPGTYWVQVTVGCCTVSDTVHVGSGDAPAIDLGPDQYLCPGATLVLAVETTLEDVLWSTGSTGSSITVEAPGTYWVQVGLGDCASSDTITVMAAEAPPVSISGPGALTCIAPCVELEVLGVEEGDELLWSTASMEPVIEVCEAGAYWVLVTSGVTGCTASATAFVQQTTALPQLTTSDAVITCSTPCALLQATAPGNGIIFMWQGPTGPGSGPQFQVCMAGTYTVTAVNFFTGCSSTATAHVTAEQEVPDVMIGGATVLTCSDPCQELVASGPEGLVFTWSGPGGAAAGATINACAPGTYTVTGTDPATGCSGSATVMVEGDANVPDLDVVGSDITCVNTCAELMASSSTEEAIFSWSTPAGTGEGSQITACEPGSYTVTVSDPATGCSASATLTVMEDLAAPDLNVLGDNITCTNACAQLFASSGQEDATFSWTGPDGTVEGAVQVACTVGTYTVTATDASNGCTATASTAVISDQEPPEATITGGHIGCEADCVDLVVNSPGPDVSFAWNTPTGSADGPVYEACAPGSYEVVVLDASNGCTTTLTFEVEQVSDLEIVVEGSCGPTLAGDGQAWVSVVGDDVANYGILWSTGATTAVIEGLDAGTYTVTVTGSGNCSAAGSVTLACDTNCDLRTQTQGGWGAKPNGNNPGVYLHAHFDQAFPQGVQIGCDRTLVLTSAQAVTAFLPSGGQPSMLPPGTLTDPVGYGNVLAGQLVAATISVGLDAADAGFGYSANLLGNTYVTSGPFMGMQVHEVLDAANTFIGGCGGPWSAAQLNAVLTAINENYVDGTSNGGFLSCTPPGGKRSGHMEEAEILTAHPVPASEQVVLSIQATSDGPMDLIMLDATGRRVRELGPVMTQAGVPLTATIDVSALENGAYYILAMRGAQRSTVRIVVAR